MSLVKEIQSWPQHWATCPVYRKGHEIKNDDGSVDIADGKRPLNQSHRSTISPARTALRLEQYPRVFGAAGVFTGPRSGGLVLLDVDANLAIIREKYGKDLTGPCVTSTKKNAAKYLFTIPEELWHTVSDCSHAFTKQGFEILWGRMGVLAGAYPGKESVGAPEGEYTLTGDLQALPEAPAWLIALMQESQAEKDGRSSSLTGSKQVDLYRNWSWEQRYEICRACLSVIPPEGGGNDLWWRIGAMVHAAGLDDHGLELWSDWSKRDPEYAADWEAGNPCEVRWVNFNDRGGYTIRSLIGLANQYDPEKRRFQGNDLERLVEETEAAVQKFQQATLGFEEAMSRVAEAMELDDPGHRNYALNQIALQAGYRDQAKLEQVYVDHVGFKESPGQITLDRIEQFAVKRDYLIPDLLPTPAVVVVYGSGGDGKSMSAWTLARHVVDGIPFVVRGKQMPVKQGGVVILNGDQPIADLQEQLIEADYPMDERTLLRPDWSLQYYAQFVDLMKKRRPALVVIDSLIGCSGGKAFDENKSDFAMPLYWMTRNNGVLWPATTILIIHHANKTGGFRGTSAIRDAVSETWKLSKPEPGKSELLPHQRLITIEKSRCGRSGAQLLMQQEDDLSFSIRDFTPEVDESNTTPASHTDRVLQRIRTAYPRWLTSIDLKTDPVVGGKASATTKALQRLSGRGLIEFEERPSRQGCPLKAYRAVLPHTRGEVEKVSTPEQIPCAGTEEKVDSKASDSKVSTSERAKQPRAGHSPKAEEGCPPSKPSAGAESALKWTPGEYPHARDERSKEELERLNDQAWNQWD